MPHYVAKAFSMIIETHNYHSESMFSYFLVVLAYYISYKYILFFLIPNISLFRVQTIRLLRQCFWNVSSKYENQYAHQTPRQIPTGVDNVIYSFSSFKTHDSHFQWTVYFHTFSSNNPSSPFPIPYAIKHHRRRRPQNQTISDCKISI